ncbi:MAG: aconitase family protein, partial [Sphingomonadaceae bacterium]
WGVGSSEAEHAMATGVLRLKRPQQMRISFSGQLALEVTAKDMVMALISSHGASGGAGYAVEFAGNVVAGLDMEARMTLCNMATEFSAMTGIVAPDVKTFSYLAGKRYAPAKFEALCWSGLQTDTGAQFDAEIEIDCGDIAPMVSWGTSPAQSIPVVAVVPQGPQHVHDYIGLSPGTPISGTPIDAAFIGSCTNSRITDLRRAAAIVKGRHIAPSIRKALVVPGSSAVSRQAEAEGLDRIFVDAGFEWRRSGCSMCFYAGGEGFPEGSRTISSTNRNFEGRQGPGIRTHIASPATVAASALAGAIADPRNYTNSGRA